MRSHQNGKATLDRARTLYAASRKLVRKGSTKAKSFILSKPLLSTLIGVASGFALGMLFRPRS